MAGTDPAQLHATIVRAAVPLIGEYDTWTTARIADAAGIDEATLRTVFDDPEAILQACVAAMTAHLNAAFDPAEALRQLDSIPLDRPLADRLVAVLDILDAFYRRVRADLQQVGTGSFSRQDFRSLGRLPDFREAVATLLEPDEQHLCLPAGVLADAFLGLCLGGARSAHPDQSLPAEQLVRLFLHGALA